LTLPSHSGRFDRFEVLKACRSAFLNQLTALLRDSRLVSDAAIGAVIEGTGHHFDSMQISQRTGSFAEEARGLTSSRITLVGDDDLELEIRFDELCKRLTETTSVPLWKTHLRFMTLLGRADLPKTHNPVGPQGILAGLQSLFTAAGATTLEEKTSLLDRIEAVLRDGLPVIYNNIDDLLHRAGAEAAQANAVVANEPARPATSPLTPPIAVQSASSPLSQSAEKRDKPALVGRLLSQAALDNLMFRLDQLERNQRNNTDFLTATSPQLEALIPGLFGNDHDSKLTSMQAVRAHDLGVPAATVEGQAIDAVGQFYSTVFADPDLPDALKLVIAELQVIMVKLSLKDKTLFSRTDHPLRLLIDRVGQLFNGLPANVGRQHPSCRELSQIIARLKDGFAGHVESVEHAANAVNELLAAQLREISSQAAAYMPLLLQIDRRDKAASDIRRLLDAHDMGGLPPVLQDFFRLEWKRLLEKAWFEEGVDGPTWQALARTLSALLWSFRPKADGEERQALARELPLVLKSFKAGMDQLGMNADAQSRVLDACFELQTRAMRPITVSVPDGYIAAPPQRSRQQMTQGRVEAGDLILHTLDFPSPAGGEFLDKLPGAGTWLGVHLDGMEHTLCLCHRSQSSGRSLLFSPDPRIAVSIHPQLLDLRLGDGSIRRLDNPPLFARLLDRAVATRPLEPVACT